MRLFLILSLLQITCVVGLTQPGKGQQPIAKEGLLRSLNRKVLPARVLIQEVGRRGVTFLLTPAAEQEIRKAGAYIGKEDLEALIDAVRDNLRLTSGPVQGRVLGINGIPIEGVVVVFSNMDKESVSENATTTDQKGIFVADLLADQGYAAYVSLTTPSGGCSSIIRISSQLYDLSRNEGHLDEPHRQAREMVLHISCPSK